MNLPEVEVLDPQELSQRDTQRRRTSDQRPYTFVSTRGEKGCASYRSCSKAKAKVKPSEAVRGRKTGWLSRALQACRSGRTRLAEEIRSDGKPVLRGAFIQKK